MELLIVVSLIALLIGLLLPMLSRARESARLTGCVSNLRQIGVGMEGYLGAHREEMPAGRAVYGKWYRGYTFGGRMVRPDSVLRKGILKAPKPYERPMNLYVVGDRASLGNANWSVEELDAIDLPVYHCPSDLTYNYQEDFWTDLARFTMSNYDAAGTSYSFNVMWQDEDAYLGKPGKAFRKFESMRLEKPSLFVPIMDDPAEWALWARRMNSIPHHGRAFTHSLLFFDGHVKAVKVDPNDRVTGEYRVMFEESES